MEGSVPAHLSHIRSFKKDVYDLNVTPNTGSFARSWVLEEQQKRVGGLKGISVI